MGFISLECPGSGVKQSVRPAKRKKRRRFPYEGHPETIIRRALEADQASGKPFIRLVVDNTTQNRFGNK